MTYGIQDNKLVKLTEAEDLASTATKPGDFARHLSNKHGLARHTGITKAWYVDAVANTVKQVEIIMVVGSGIENIGPPAYVVTVNQLRLPSFYVFPVARHLKPKLATLRDEYGTCQQWVAPLKSNVKGPWA